MATPVVLGVTPATGVTGASVTIGGTGFTGATAVNFGSVAAGGFTVNGDNEIVAQVPAPNASGPVHVTVTNPDGTSATGSNDQFAYNVCGVATFNVPTARSGCTTVAAGAGNKMGEKFNMEIDFDSTGPGCVCSCCEYRQFVRGTFTVNGVTKVKMLRNPAGGPPLKLLPRPAAGAASDNFREDGLVTPDPGMNVWYGHRAEPITTDTTDIYQQPDRATGCQYRGNDFPGYAGLPGTTVSIDLDFRGQVIDTCNGNAVVQQIEWTVTCSGTL
ncbi:MAG TPA: IPT/TIG domain-containing protein [Candidatus Binatia bacterium]|nr:IPT/TIG domain-containing protein [Candidatus Binatia bacterium]